MSESLGRNWKLLESRAVTPGAARIIAIANQKGGVGKSTTCINLGAALALRGHRVLVVDIDPQANATTGLGVDHRDLKASSYQLLVGAADLEEVVVPARVDGLELVPSSLDLAGAEIELVSSMARERKLAEALDDLGGRYELVFLDCPPSLGLLTVNALAAAQDLIIPVQCEYYALEGLGQLLGTAERVRRALNPELRVAGFLLTMHDARTKLSLQVAQDVRTHFGELVYRTVIPRSIRLSEAPSFGEPVVTLHPSSAGSSAYRLLAAEVEDRYMLEPAPEHATSGDGPQGAQGDEHAPVPAPGPGGRGYGTSAPEPAGVEESWPPAQPFGSSP